MTQQKKSEQDTVDPEALFSLSYGMCIICSASAGKYSGCIINTAFQIVPEPVMMAVSVNKKSLTNQYIKESGFFSISVLSQQTPVKFIGKFGFRTSRDIDKFEDVEHSTGQNSVPVITENAIAVIEAEVKESIDVFTHTLFVAEIKACRSLDSKALPMTYDYYRSVKAGRTPETAATYHKTKTVKKKDEKKMQKYKCLMCGYIYDPQLGDPDNGIDPGTDFADIPDDWVCPECGAGKDEFAPLD